MLLTGGDGLKGRDGAGLGGPRADRERPRAVTTCLIILATLGIFAVAYFAHALIMPVVLALFFAMVLSPPVEAMRRRGVPGILASALVMLLVAGVIASLVNATREPASEWVERAPRVLSDLDRKIRPIQRFAVKIDEVAAQAGRVTGVPESGPEPAPAAPSRGLLWKTPAAIIPVVGVFFLTFFFLSSGPVLLMKLAESRRRMTSARQLVTVAEHVRRQMARYLGTIATINVGLGAATAALAWAFELPTPLLWGVMAGLFNFIPYAGSAITLVVLTIVAILTHDTLGPAVGVAASYLAIATLEGQVVQPLALGRRLALSPLIVFLGLWLWGWLWGVAGMFLATPILLTVKAISCELKSWSAVAEFLGPARAPPITARAREWRRFRRRLRASVPIEQLPDRKAG
jgi:predicted PurR-regulated permease PerM